MLIVRDDVKNMIQPMILLFCLNEQIVLYIATGTWAYVLYIDEKPLWKFQKNDFLKLSKPEA